MERITDKQIELLNRVATALADVSRECFDDCVFCNFIDEVIPRFDLAHRSLDDLASQWEEAIQAAHSRYKRDYKLESQLYPFLYEIADYNRSLMEDTALSQQVDEKPTDYTEKMFTFEHYGQMVADPFHDETLREEVDPFKYYDPEKLKALVTRWIRK